MQKSILRLGLLFLSFQTALQTLAQVPPFRDEIMAFKRQDSIAPPKTGEILFTGSSSFRIWKDVDAAFPGYGIINRGFGGSTLPDVTRYVKELIFPYKPRQIVLYCGDNDLAVSDTVTAQVVYRRFQELYKTIREGLPNTPILYVSIKPSPSRERLLPRILEANLLIKNYLHQQKHTAYADVYYPMLSPEGKPVDSLFQSDKLHMNANGYAIWQKVLLPYLLKK